jgi:Spy/CpxP family protein refolding chaperone
LRAAVDGLQLTGETKTKAGAVLAKADEDIKKVIADGAGDPRAARTSAIATLRSAEEDLLSLLDEDQKILFQGKLKAADAADPGPGNAGPGAGPGGRPGGVGPGPGGPGGARPMAMGQRVKEATAGLGLSDDQKTKVEALVADTQKKMDELRGGAGPGPEMREKLMAIREDLQKQIKEILTAEQYTKFEDAMRQGGPGGGAAGGRVGGALQRLQEVVAELTLTDEQKTTAKAALDGARKKLQELVPQLQGGQPGPEVREKLRGLFEELRTELGKVLTPEQMEKVRGALPGGGGGAGGARPGGDAKPAEKL